MNQAETGDAAAFEDRFTSALAENKAQAEEEAKKPKPVKPYSGLNMAVFHLVFIVFLTGIKGYIALQLMSTRALTAIDASPMVDVENYLAALQLEVKVSWWMMLVAFLPIIPVAMMKRSAKAHRRYFKMVLFVSTLFFLSQIILDHLEKVMH